MADKKDEVTKRVGPAPTGLPPREKLPESFQKIIDKAEKEDNLYDELYDGTFVTLLSPFSLLYKAMLAC